MKRRRALHSAGAADVPCGYSLAEDGGVLGARHRRGEFPRDDIALLKDGPRGCCSEASSSRRAAAQAVRDSIAPVADTYVVAEAPGTVYGTSAKLAASNWRTHWHSQAYLKFTVPAPPAGQSIASARLEMLYQKTEQQADVTELRSVADNSWTESMTYPVRPAPGPVVATATLPAGAPPASVSTSPPRCARPGRTPSR
ncbi:DNRLRE domain-containing protein [Nonomuraea sp. NPDC001831]|uniref:CBM96 family carbohydrate-binding protein n=1 Tax=Nonomuraea sp. NPDC001831 TaxID=3364340 RepID=UPI0036ACDAF2